MSTDAAIEAEIQAKGLTAARITPADIEANIASEHYFTAQQGVMGESIASGHACSDGSANPLNLLTFCVLVLKNGFTVTGESACASPENFDAGVGRKIARQNAAQKIWQLMGYLLRERLHAAGPGPKYTTDSITECRWHKEANHRTGWPQVGLGVRMKDGKTFTHVVDEVPCEQPGAMQKRAMTELLRIANGETP